MFSTTLFHQLRHWNQLNHDGWDSTSPFCRLQPGSLLFQFWTKIFFNLIPKVSVLDDLGMRLNHCLLVFKQSNTTTTTNTNNELSLFRITHCIFNTVHWIQHYINRHSDPGHGGSFIASPSGSGQPLHNFYLWLNKSNYYLILLSWKLFIKTTESKKQNIYYAQLNQLKHVHLLWLCGKGLISVWVGLYAWINSTICLFFAFNIYFHFNAAEFTTALKEYIRMCITYLLYSLFANRRGNFLHIGQFYK